MHLPARAVAAGSGGGGGFGRISVVGSGASQLLSRVIKPLLSPDISDKNIENGVFFNQVLQSEGINVLWKHNEGLSFEALDCRELCFKEKGRTEIRERNPYQTWTSLGASPVQARPASPRGGGGGKPSWRKTKTLSLPASPVTSSFFRTHAAGCGRTDAEASVDDEVATNVSDAALNAMRQQQREEAYQFCGDSSTKRTSAVSKSAKGAADTWTFVPRSASGRDPQQQERGEESMRSKLKFQILLIRKSQTEDNDKGRDDVPLCFKGWDIIVPEEHCAALWLALNYAGGRSIGLEERSAVENAMQTPSFPRDFPDTAAGSEHWREQRRVNHLQRQARPARKRKQNKRQERVPNLKTLFGDGEEGSSLRKVTDLVVMRNVEFARPFFPKQLLAPTKHAHLGHLGAPSVKFAASEQEHHDITDVELPVFPFPTLIRVCIAASGRGTPQCGAELLQPLRGDYEQWLEHRQHRSAATTTEHRRLGDWNGAAGRGSSAGGRVLLGVVSSALQPDLFRTEKSGIAFCEAGKLSQMVSFSSCVLKGTGNNNDIVPLIMYRNPLCEIIRPALFQLCLS
jgi:hypothetical protein